MSTPPRLTRQTPAAIPGIVHLGPGAFFKAFNGVFTDDLMRQRGGDWGIIAIGLQSDRAALELRPQGCVYTSVSMAPDGTPARVIEALTQVLVAPQQFGEVMQAMSDPKVTVLSLTITEKGYCRNPATGGLDVENAAIQVDLAQTQPPKTAPGLIVEALARRRAAGERPFTVLSCDNLPDNGATTRRIILEYARLRDPSLADWIASQARFPATMVDRITPATTAEDIAHLSAQTGYYDAACVHHEPFRQWVIEDNFVDGLRPAWDAVGAQFVNSVAAHETMKLRCLNGTHSTLAYLGYLAGFETIAQTVADPAFALLCEHLWANEILPTVAQPQGEDLNAYVAALMTRYRNPAIQHRTWQIAMDGSQKLPQRILGTVQDALAGGSEPDGLCLAVAGWMRYVGGVDENGHPIDVRDPMARRLKEASDGAADTAGKVDALLAFGSVFPPALAVDARFRSIVTQAYEQLAGQGALKTVQDLVAARS